MNITPPDAVHAVLRVLANRGDPDTDVAPESTFQELRFDSLDLAEALIILEEGVGAELDPASAGVIATVADLTRLRPRPAQEP